MRVRKFLAILLVLCMMLGGVGITAMAEQEADIIVPGEAKTITLIAVDGYVDDDVYFCFTPEESGDYIFSASYEDVMDTGMEVWLKVDDGEDYFSYGEPLVFSAEAGVTYWLCGNYSGYEFGQIDCTFLVEKCQKLEGIELSADQDIGYVGGFLVIDVEYIPMNGQREEINWTVSDPAVAEIVQSEIDHVGVSLLGPGTATITATTVGGVYDSVEISVMELPALELGENDVTIPAYEQVPFGFTPETDGYYLISTDNDDIGCTLIAEKLFDGTNEYYVLEAGATYNGYLYNWSQENLGCTVSIEYFEEVVIIDPVSIEIVKLPDNVTYLRDTLENVWNDDCLSGLELKVTWSDGSVSNWNYDENFGMLGTGYVGGFLNEKEDGGYEVEVYASAADVEPVFFDLTILDIMPVSIALVDESPLQIVEFSCGIDIGALGLDAEGWYYLPLAAYDREVVITFSDGSTVTAKPGDVVYGEEVICQDNQGGIMMRTQPEGFWTKDSENLIGYLYGELYATLAVEIIDSPVESIELVGKTENTFAIDEDDNIVNQDGQIVESLKGLLAGLELKVNYIDGTSRTFTEEEIQWREMLGMEFPFVDGYPIGVMESLMDILLNMEDVMEAPDKMELTIEYMGQRDVFTLRFVEKFEDEGNTGDDNTGDNNTGDGNTDKPDVEFNPTTGDSGMLLAVLVVAVLGAAVVIVKNEKLMV